MAWTIMKNQRWHYKLERRAMLSAGCGTPVRRTAAALLSAFICERNNEKVELVSPLRS